MATPRIVKLASGGTLEVLEDGTRIQRNPEGTVLTLYPNGVKVQQTKDGIQIEVRPDGSRTQTMANGVKLLVKPDGSSEQTNPDGTVIETYPDKRRIQRHNDGTSIEIYPDGTRIQTFPDGKKLEIDAEGQVKPLNFNPESDLDTNDTPKPSKGPDSTSSESKLESDANTIKMGHFPLDTKGSTAGSSASPKPPADVSSVPTRPKRDSFRGIGRVPLRSTSVDNVLLKEISALKIKVAEYEEKIQATERETEEKIENLENYVISINEEKLVEGRKKDLVISQLNQKIENDSRTIARLTTEIENFKTAQMADGDAKASAESREIDAAQNKIQSLEADLQETARKCLELESTLVTLQQNNTSLEAKNEELIHKGGSVAESVANLQAENESLQAQNDISFQENAKLNQDLAEALMRSSDLELKVTKLLSESHLNANIGIMQKRDLYLSKYKEYQVSEKDKVSETAINPLTSGINASFDSGISAESKEKDKKRSALGGRNFTNLLFGKKDRKGSSEKVGFTERIGQLESRIQELEVNISQKDLMIKAEIEINKELKSKVNQLNSLVVEEQQGSSAVSSTTQDEAEMEEIKRQLEDVSVEKENFAAENEALLVQLQDYAAAVETLKAEVDKIPQNEQEIQQLNAEVSNLIEEKESLMQEVVILKSKLEEKPQPQTTPNAQVGSTPDPALIKYSRMLKNGVPKEAVKLAMSRDGLSASLFDTIDPSAQSQSSQREPVTQNAPPPQPPARTQPNSESAAEAPSPPPASVAKYSRMKSAGVPEGAIKIAMQRDGVDTNLLFPSSSPVATPAKKPSPPAPSGFLAEIANKPKLNKTTPVANRTKSASNGNIGITGNPLLAEIQASGKTRLRRVSERGPVTKPDSNENKNTIAELCRLKAQQRANRSEKMKDLMQKRSEPEKGNSQSELQAALKRRAQKLN